MTPSKFPSSQPRSKKRFLLSLKIFILLSPIPFGCVGKIWSPLFYMCLVVLTYFGAKVIEEQNIKQVAGDWGPDAKDRFKVQSSRFKVKEPNVEKSFSNTTTTTDTTFSSLDNILYGKWIKRFFVAFLIFVGLQIIPLPITLVKFISPKKIEVLGRLMDDLPSFTSISWVPFDTFIYVLITLLYGLFFMVLFGIRFQKKEMVSLLNVLVLGASVQVVFGLLKLAQGNTRFFLFFYPVKKSEISKFLTGTLGNANHFAFFLEMVIPLALALFFFRLRFLRGDVPWKQRILSVADENKIILAYFIGISLMGTGIILTGTRAGIVTLVFVFIVFAQLLLFLKIAPGVRRKMVWILAAIFVLVVFIGIQNTFAEFKRSQIIEAGRFTRWPNTINMFQDYPVVGTGMGTYRYAFYLYDTGPGRWSTHAHNDILEVFAEGGILGGFLFFFCLGILFVSLIRKWLGRRYPDIRILGAGILVSIFAVTFHSIFDFSLRIPSNMLIFVLILVLGIKIVNYKSRRSNG